MNRNELRTWFVSSLKDSFHIDLPLNEIKDQSSFKRDLGLDSLFVTDMVIQCEMFLNVRINIEDIRTLDTVGAVVDYLYHLPNH